MKVNIVSVAVKHWIGVMKMAELIEMPYGNEKALAGEFVKKYSEVQLDVEMKRKQCFVNSHCSSDCPNAEYEMADDRYGFGIADDMGLEKISCKQCRYNTGRCEDCLFIHSKDCPEYKESEDEKKMLDRYFFRGKTFCDGDWVYGGITWNPSRKKFFIHTDWEEAKVIPETIGQYTGLTDKNGVKIFEGDICWFYGGDYYSGLWEQNAIVAITDMTDDEQTHYLNNAEYCEVIGNVFDNPELLEGDKT